jgi:hypothetical protein
MLPIVFAALLGLLLGRCFKVAALAPALVATAIFALLVERSNAIAATTLFAAVALAALTLQLGYLIGSASAPANSRPRDVYPPAPSASQFSADL